MPIGKGYFWEGLSRGVRGLYGDMQNERMANEAQAERAQQAGLSRAENARQFDALVPRKTNVPDLSIPYLEQAKGIAKQKADEVKAAAGRAYDDVGKAVLQKKIEEQRVADENVAKAMSTAAAKAGSEKPDRPGPSPKPMGIMDQFRQFQDAKKKGIK